MISPSREAMERARAESAALNRSGALSAQRALTVRDYFAGQALIAEARNWETPGVTPEAIAENCYALADAMLAARATPESEPLN